MNLTLKTPIEKLPQIGAAYIKRLHKIGIETVEDLLFYFPFRYDDFSKVKKVSEVEIGEVVSICGRILDIQNVRTWKKKMNITEALVEDETGVIKAIWFNQPFLVRNLRKGVSVSLSGKVTWAQEGLQLSNPAYEILGSRQALHTGRLVPVYHETEGLSSKWLRMRIKSVIKLANEVEDYLPYEVIKRQKLFSLPEAVRQIHFPFNAEKAETARRRLAFDELFLIQLYMLSQKKKWQKNKAVSIKFDDQLRREIKNFVDSLPFKLTNAQRISAWSIIKDLEKPRPMNRLLEGDVGSGKTLVALIAALAVVKSGYQTAFMAPTEILARQHFEEAVKRIGGLRTLSSSKTLSDEEKSGKPNSNSAVTAALLTGNESRIYEAGEVRTASKKELLEKIKKGEIGLVFGTHSLIQKEVSFGKLALSIVDEQHRFGIEQRAKLQKEVSGIRDGLKTVPHLLSMTATPIPRTLALAVYGDLDLSILDEMPKGRQKIITKLIAPANRELAYQFIRGQIKKGRQAFVICPLIEESDVLEVKSATQEYEKLKNVVYPDLKIGLLHGKMKSKEKEKVMRDFSEGKIDILVSTSVVEVGIDVPNATVMVIEGAERFGLAQLHQFRGRVGRGRHQSFCFLFTDSTSSTTHKRLKAFMKSEDGFELAKKDLEIRGPGELIGIRQSGIPDLAMASLSDADLIKSAREEAQRLLGEDSELRKYPKLAEKLKKFTKKVHFE